MDRKILNSFEEKGLPCPFVATKQGNVEIAQSGASLSKEISQMATVIFETIGAVGDIKVDAFEIMGAGKGIVMTLRNDQLFGALFPRREDQDMAAIRTLLQDLSTQSLGVVKPSKPVLEKKPEEVVKEVIPEEIAVVEKEPVREKKIEAKPVEPAVEVKKVKLETDVLDNIKSIMKDFLGDFTERIFKNQVKAQRINVDELFDEDARRLVFALGKAAGMIIGPSKGRDMTNKLLEILK